MHLLLNSISSLRIGSPYNFIHKVFKIKFNIEWLAFSLHSVGISFGISSSFLLTIDSLSFIVVLKIESSS